MADLKWNGRFYEQLIHAGLKRNMFQATALLERFVKARLRFGQPRATLPGGYATGVKPSFPGESPRSFTGQLRKTIFRRVFVEGDVIIGQVGSPSRYARALELGRPGGGRRIRARRSSVLIIPLRKHVTAPENRFRFGRQAKVGKKKRALFVYRRSARMSDIEPRPFLIPALKENIDRIRKVLGKKIVLPIKKGPP